MIYARWRQGLQGQQGLRRYDDARAAQALPQGVGGLFYYSTTLLFYYSTILL